MKFDTQGISYIVQKLLTLAPQIDASYTGRITANVTDSFSSITFFVVNRADSRSYGLKVQTNQGVTASDVVIAVQGRLVLLNLKVDHMLQMLVKWRLKSQTVSIKN